MKNQRDLIDNVDWDLLVVLDACRYDYFEWLYKKYLQGELKRVISSASHTFEWCLKMAGDGRFKDTICVSANPHINSLAPVRGVDPKNKFKQVEWDPRDKFKRIYDVWLPQNGEHSIASPPPFASVVLNFDYGIYGIMSIGCMQLLMKDTELGVISFLVLNLVFSPAWPAQIFSLFALLVILLQKRWNTLNADRKIDAKNILGGKNISSMPIILSILQCSIG